MSPTELKWKQHDTFYEKINRGIYQEKYPQALGLSHCFTKIRMEFALHAFEYLKKYLPPKEMQEFPFRCALHSFLTHVKSAIDSLTEEINLLYKIDPKLATKGKTMSIGKLLGNSKYKQKLMKANSESFTEISNTSIASWFTELKTSRNEEAVHGAISGKKWQVILDGSLPITKLGNVKGISDYATWCPRILKETNKFLERCYQQM